MNGFRIIYENRFPIQQRREDGTWGCRGCGGVIPKGRQTWCSKACNDTFNPNAVMFRAKQRDKQVCGMCGYDAAEAGRLWWIERREVDKLYRSNVLAVCQGSTVDNSEYRRRLQEWQDNRPRKIEYDHIIPFSEGGLTILENIRSLCSDCHKTRTRDWRAERSNKSRVLHRELEFV